MESLEKAIESIEWDDEGKFLIDFLIKILIDG